MALLRSSCGCLLRTTTLKLSVVLCTYNGATFLSEQLESLLAQTRLPDEIVVGDDGSTDDTWSLLEAFVGRSRERGVVTLLVRHPANLGFVANFSEMIRSATGDLLFLCDQDDLWSPQKLATMEQCFLSDPELLLLCSNATLVGENGESLHHMLFEALELRPRELRKLHQGRAFDVLLRRSMATGATLGFRRVLVSLALPVGAGWIHDEWLAIVAASCGRVDVLEEPLIDYRQHAQNQVGMRKRKLLEKWGDLVRPMRLQFEHEVSRMEVLHRRLEISASEVFKTQVAHRRAHFRNRVALGQRPRFRRLGLVLREACAGNYWRYGTGLRAVLRDLLRYD